MRKGKLVIDGANAALDWGVYGSDVRKIVLGDLRQTSEDHESSADVLDDVLPADLAERFPELTHVHLWGLAGLRSVPPLPDRLVCLDIRGCGGLSSLPPMSSSLEELILEDAAHLTTLEVVGSLEHLWDLSLKGCVGLPREVIQRLLDASPHLRRLDLSGCTLDVIRAWPRELERIDLNGCRKLRVLPAVWPAELRRLGLRGASAVDKLPPFGRWPDYVDLAGTEKLTTIDDPAGLRTLFLYGSGLRMPPASQHGAAPDENVAASTLAYYEDVGLCGTGDVKRCKLLILGNGSAGKTCMSLALVPGGDPGRAEELGTTHAVQFWDWELKGIQVGSFASDVALQLWDFGGQEIYHNTHRLFMSKGAVFVVAWDPAQDGEQPPPDKNGHQDVWRPLQYWLDFIHLACPWNPRIAVVCTHHAEKTDELERRFRAQMGPHWDTCSRFYVDSLHRAGQIKGLEEWVERSVCDVVEEQGTAVPAYWEIAQDLVHRWLPRPDPERAEKLLAGEHDELSFERFGELLGAEIERRLASPEDAARFAKLRRAHKGGRFELTTDRVTHTLQFLTNSGWVFWDRDLIEQRVIVGQRWALDGIYAALERRKGTTIFERLRARRGQFTRCDLDEWVWREAGYTEQQQRLLISFMLQVGVCFPLVSEHESLWRESVYCSFEHLPTLAELAPARRFDSDRNPVGEEAIANDRLHRLHWNAILGALGGRYGRDAAYAADGFELRNKEGQHIRVVVWFSGRERAPSTLEQGGLGGGVTVRVAGPEAEARLAEMVQYLRSFLPAADPLEMPARPQRERDPGGERRDVVTVFVSYAWQPTAEQLAQNLVELPVPYDYEEPIDRIEKALAQDRAEVKLWRDKQMILSGESISDFIRLVRTADKVLIVHSDKYWRSPYCMWEFTAVVDRFLVSEDNIRTTLITVQHETSGIGDHATLEGYRNHWKTVSSFPSCLEEVGITDVERFRRSVLHALDKVAPKIHATFQRDQRWTTEDADAVIDWIRTELGLTGVAQDRPLPAVES